MTEVRGLIGNWLTWRRYTWSHNVSHPSCVGELGAFFTNHQQQKKKKKKMCFILVPLCREKLCGWSHVASNTSKPALQRESGMGMIFAWRMQLSASCECRGASCTSVSDFPWAVAPASATNTQKKTTHWCRGSGERSAPSFSKQDGRPVSFCESRRLFLRASATIPDIWRASQHTLTRRRHRLPKICTSAPLANRFCGTRPRCLT